MVAYKELDLALIGVGIRLAAKRNVSKKPCES